MTEGAEKAPNVGRRPTAGDYKGAQPPYRADKRAERAMSARLKQKSLYKTRRGTVLDSGKINLLAEPVTTERISPLVNHKG